MSKIDWSKAPEGATHWGPSTQPDSSGEAWVEGFYRLEGDDWQHYNLHRWDGDMTSWSNWPERFKSLSVRPALWDGTGLPPVGTVCEFVRLGGADWHRELRDGAEVIIIAHFDVSSARLAAFTFEFDGGVQVEQAVENCFRPIRTPEHIAAEDRKKTINEMVYGACGCEPGDGTTTTFMICGYLYDAGYRKQEQSE